MAKEEINALAKGQTLTSGQHTYHIEKVLGAGGFGITYLVSSEIMVGNVPFVTYFALKEHFLKKACERKDSKVCSTLNNSEDVEKSRENFLSEAKRLNRLSASHNNIVKVNESFTANDTAYYVMEYIEGPSLRDLVNKRGDKPLTWEEALNIIRPIADAISFLHDNRLTHLDIKPDNIILDSKKDNRPVLIDFGLSKHYDRNGNATSTLLGTGYSDGYSPIEQYVGITSFSPRADIYSLAATLLFLVTGKDPVIATKLNESKIRSDLSGKAPEYAIQGMVDALKMQSEERTVSVKEFIDSISSPKPEEVFSDNNDTENKPAIYDRDTVLINSDSLKKNNNKKIITIISSFIVLLAIGCALFFLTSQDKYEKLPDGSKFYGLLDDEGNPHGEGRLVTTSGNEFEGSWRNGVLEKGVLRTAWYTYEGTFEMMVPSGYGTRTQDNGITYTGHWEQGNPKGLGKWTIDETSIEFGLFRNDSLINEQPFTVGEKVYGIDVSKWQRQINWQDLYLPADENGTVSNGGEFMQPVFYALLKATDGTDVDDYYDRNYLNAKRCGIVCGAYHFLTTKKTVEEQVKSFIESAHLEEGDLPPILDLELPHDVMKENRKEICDMALAWLENIEEHYGVKPLIYTYYSFISDYLSDPRFDNYEYFIAYHSTTLPPVKNWVIWQFSEQVRTPAITANTVDADIFNGDYSDFMKYIRSNGIK